MPRPFFPGWSAGVAQMGREAFEASGRELYEGPRFAADNRPLPEGYSLSGLLKWIYNQGYVGSCFANAAAHVLQLLILFALANGSAGKAFNPSRRLIWYRCRQLDGSLGRAYDGGSIVNSMAAIGEAPQGIGDCSEDVWPYKANHAYLEQTPPASVIKAADAIRVKTIADVIHDEAEAIQRDIFNGKPHLLGFDWCSGWDEGLIDAYGRTTGVGRAVGGHALARIGYLKDWDGYLWYEILNTHGKIYPNLPPEIASRVVGYTPTSSTFWVREDMLAEVLGRQYAEAYVGSEVTGFEPQPLTVAEALAE